MGLCGGSTAWLPMGPLVAAGRMSRAKSNHFPVPRMFCLPQRKIKRAGKGKEGSSMWECFHLSLCHCLSLSLCLSTPLSVCLNLLFSLSQCLYTCLSVFVVSLCFSMSASISRSLSLCFSLSLSLFLFFLFPSSLPPPFLFLLPF